MDIKYCPECGKELPKEANFCPYCMTKLIAEDGTDIPITKKNNRKKLYIITLLLLIIIAVQVAIVVVLSGNNNGNTADNDKNVNITKEAVQSIAEPEDYSQYLGVWIDEEHKNSEDVSHTGGKKIEICKVQGEEIIFNIVNYSSYAKKAYVDYIKVKLIDGNGNFSFSDDGFGNSGSGEIKLSNGKIYARVELDNSRVGGEWDLSMDAVFVQTEKYTKGQIIDISDCLTTLDTQKVKFGNRTDIEKYGDSISYIYDQGITLDVEDLYDTGEMYITKIYIDYDSLQSDYKYCYKGIDNNSTKEDVKRIFKELKTSDETFIADEEYYYYRSNQESVITHIYFNSEGYVNSIDYAAWY